MIAFATLLLATPVFGFSLHAPPSEPRLLVMPASHSAPAALSPVVAAALSMELAGDDSDSESATASTGQTSPAQDEAKAYREQTKRRNALAKQHRLLGMSTWAAMTVTVALGVIQYSNLYGIMADEGSNPCVKGTAIFGQGQCTGTPWPHLVAASITTALYATTFTISLLMPDPDDLANSKGAFASTLRMHKLLRWVHFGGMVAQLALGAVIANNMFDRANDYKTLQLLSTVHLATGLITYGALTWAGALMTF
jgi:hypothetical protein